MNKCHYEIIYKSPKIPKPSPIISTLEEIYRFPLVEKYSELLDLAMKMQKNVKKLPNSMKKWELFDKIGIMELLRKGIGIKNQYLYVTLVISLILKICESMGIKIVSKTHGISLDLLGIVLAIVIFSLFSDGYASFAKPKI